LTAKQAKKILAIRGEVIKAEYMKSKAFEHLLQHIKNRYDFILLKRILLKSLLILLLSFNLYFCARFFLKSPRDIILTANLFRITAALGVLFVIFQEYKQRPNLLKLSRWLDNLQGSRDDLYQNILELQKDETVAKSDLYRKLYKQGTQRLSEQIVIYPPVASSTVMRVCLFILLGLALFWGMNASVLPRSLNEFWFNQIQTANQINSIEVKPGNLTVGRNTDVLIEVADAVPELQYILLYKLENQWREVAMPEGRFLFENLDYSFQYYVRTGQIKSGIYQITVLDNPAVRRYYVTYHYPAYTGLKTESDSSSYGNISALRHTLVTLNLETNIPMQTVKMNFSDGQSKTLQKRGEKSFVTQLEVLENLTWYPELIDTLGRKNTPEEKTIEAIPDLPPEIDIPEPGDDVLLNQNLLLPLRITASDDYGLKNLLLKYQINSQNLQTVEVKSIINAANLDLDYVLSFQDKNLLPGDIVTYWAEIYDNSPEQQHAISKKYKARFPSIEEIYKEIEKQETAGKNDLKDVLNKSSELQKDFEQKRRELLKQDNLNWEDKKQLENMVKTQQELAEQVNKVADNYQQLIDKLQNNQALSQETLEKMQKIQQILSEIDNEQLQQALQQLQNSLQNLDPNAVKKAIENFKFSLEDFNQKVDQTLKLLESIKKEQAVQKALQISQEAEKMQQALQDKTNDAKNDAGKLAAEQQNIKDKLDALNEQLKNIGDLLDKDKDQQAKAMLDELQDIMQQENPAQDMQNSQQALSQNQRKQALSAQQQAQQKLRKMTNKLQAMKDAMGAGSSQQVMMAMQTAARELLIFSQQHEATADKYKQDPYPILPDLLSAYEGMQLSLNKLFSNPMVMMFIPPKFFMDANQTNQNYRDFFNNVNEVQYYNIPKNLEGIQSGLNLMAYDLIQAMNSAQGGGSGGGMESLLKMLQQMGEEQMAMNLLTQQLLQQMQQNGGRLGAAEQQQLQRLAAEQERLAENIKRALQNDPAAQKQGNTLQQMADEMEAIARQLKQNRLDQDLVDRQERILSKLLDAQKSINKREFSQKRKAETAKSNPESNVPSTDFNLLRKKAMLDEQYKTFPKEYQQVIQQYLKLLNEQK